jgi:hypothetical protein
MSISSMFNVRLAAGAVLAVVLLVAFNVLRPGIQSELEASFNDWYETTGKTVDAPQKADPPKVTVHVRLSGPVNGMGAGDWSVPQRGYASNEDRQRVARVLQLIHESGVFHLRPVPQTDDGRPYITVSIVDGARSFETTIPFSEVSTNVRLQNLLKLLEVFNATQPPAVNPTQL